MRWADVPNYEGLYIVSDNGDVKSLFRYKKILKPSKQKNGYLTVELWKNGESKRVLVHRLVASAFIPNPFNYPQVNHKDEVKSNNSLSNLEWCSAKYNMNYGNAAKTRHSNIDYSTKERKEIAVKNGKKTSKPVLQYSISGELIAKYESIKLASKITGIGASHISDVCKQKRKRAGGFFWQYTKGE